MQTLKRPFISKFEPLPASDKTDDFCIEKAQAAPLGNITSIASPSLKKSRKIYLFYLQSLARELLPEERVAWCLRRMQPAEKQVKVFKNDYTNKSHYKGLIVCGRLWPCPVCASKISEGRRRELSAALSDSDLVPILITYTVRHNAGMKLPVLLDGLLKAYRFFKAGKGFQTIIDEYGWQGSVRSLEPTHGKNGWHPHLHELVLLSGELSEAARHGLEITLKKRWAQSLAKYDLTASWTHGVDLRTARKDVAEYVAKFGREPSQDGWTLEHEVTKAVTKRGSADGRTPLQLLADYGEGDIKAGRLFQEYAKAFKGRKQLVWSGDLKKRLGVGEVSDEELTDEGGEGDRLLATLKADEWRAILRADLRGELLEAAEGSTDEEFSIWLANKLEKWLPGVYRVGVRTVDV